MTDVSYWDDLYRDRLSELADLVEAQNPDESLGGPTAQTLAQAKSILQQIENARKSYQLDMRALPRPQQGAYLEKLKGYESQLRTLKEAVTEIENQVNKTELTGDSIQQPMGNDETLRRAEEVSGKTTQKLHQVLNTVEDTTEVADATSAELERQREQLEEIQTKMLTMQGNLKYADQLIRNFTKRMMTDKFVQLFLMMNILLVIGIIAYVFLEKKTNVLKSDDDASVSTDDDILADDGSRRYLRAS